MNTKEYMRQQWEADHPRELADRMKWEEEKRLREEKKKQRFIKDNERFSLVARGNESVRELFLQKMNKIVVEYMAGKTLRQIADDYNISGERVRQILKMHPDHKNLAAKSKSMRPKKNSIRTCVCGVCSKMFDVPGTIRKKYCSRECFIKGKTKYPELVKYKGDVKKYSNERMKRYYRAVLKDSPGFKELTSRRNKEYVKKSGYYKRPEVKKRMAEFAKKRLIEIKQDPVRYQQYLEKCRMGRLRKRLSKLL